MATLSVTPNPAAPGQTVNVDGAGFDPKAKFMLTTTDSAGTESGWDVATGLPTNINRPRPDGSFKVGINVPPREGAAKVNAYQQKVLIVSANVLVQTPTPPPPADTTAPTISAVLAIPSTTTATVSWTLNEPATGQVEYGKTKAYGSLSTPETSVTYSSHSQTISGLSAGTLYHYRVKSADAAGNLAVSPDATFTTTAIAPVLPGPPTNVRATPGDKKVSLSWQAPT